MHSKPKLALAILTSPIAAFEEVLERKLFYTAVIIAAITGTLSALPYLIQGLSDGSLELFLLGKFNPLTWMGLFLLYGFAVQKLLKWLGVETSYVTVLTVMGWSQVTLLLAQVLQIVGALLNAANYESSQLPLYLVSAWPIFGIWYVLVIGAGIQVAAKTTFVRGAMTYLVVAVAASIAFSMTYGNARLEPYLQALPGVQNVARSVVASDQTPWPAAGAVGLILGVIHLAKELGWDSRMRSKMIALAAVAGVAVAGIYIYTVATIDYYGRLTSANRLYNQEKYAQAAEQFERLMPIAGESTPVIITTAEVYSASPQRMPTNTLAVKGGNALLVLDIADVYYLAGSSEQAIKYYNRYIDIIRRAEAPSKTANKDMWYARAYSGIGAVYDFDQKYDNAIQQFEKATRAWPEFRDPRVRMAVTYDRMGEYEKAIDAGNYAIKKLDSNAAVAWVALAQAFAQTGDTKQANTAITLAASQNEELAEKIGKNISDYRNAVSKLTRRDLRYPLEQAPAPQPKAPKERSKQQGAGGKR